ncbi:Response Regulator Receiver Signal Transduction Histidine Kinase [Beggiatoa sp. PS]|nr:Response Regulator Receiver Signal Transduction Histidine Kinase [Beggiatoa sp. PS]
MNQEYIKMSDNDMLFAKDSVVKDNAIFEDDEVLFADEAEIPSFEEDTWGIVIIDDEEDVHQLTRFVLEDYVYQNKKLKFISAYSAEDAKALFKQYNDIAVILLDVVMETNDAGLKLVKYIRETLQNHFVRIILRTGQPGYAPEKQVILKYDINDYKNKTELTDQKLFTVMTASLRAYSDIMTIESYRQHLEDKVAERTYQLQKKNEELIKLNQDKNEFLGIAAHDLRNPLACIQSLANLIRTSWDDFPKDKLIEFSEMIETSAQKMSSLITNLLDVYTIESGNRNLLIGQINVLPILQVVVNNYQRSAKDKQISLHFQFIEDEYLILVDENAIYQVLENLISNAVKYSQHGKNVYVKILKNEKISVVKYKMKGLDSLTRKNRNYLANLLV